MKLIIFDTSRINSEGIRANIYSTIHDCCVSILVYDITDEESFECLNKWIDKLKDKVEKDDMILYLVGNKNDVDRNEKKVPTSKGKEFAKKNNMIFHEISAKTGYGVKELFNDIANKGCKLIFNSEENDDSFTLIELKED